MTHLHSVTFAFHCHKASFHTAKSAQVLVALLWPPSGVAEPRSPKEGYQQCQRVLLLDTKRLYGDTRTGRHRDVKAL